MKGVFVILDGAADQPCRSLGEMTPLQMAKMPNLDELAKKSRIDFCYTVKEGVAPESSSAIVSLFGQDPAYAPRGPLEAQGAGISFRKGDLILRCNFATIDDLSSGQILDSRAGRTLTTAEAQELANSINEKVKLPFPFKFYTTVQHRGILVIKGGFSDNISNADPFYGVGVIKPASTSGFAKMVYSKPLDDEEESKLAAELVNQFIRHSHDVLDKHPVNLARAKKGLYMANLLLCRDAGNEPIKFKKLKGKWKSVCAMPLELGISKAFGIDAFKLNYPALKGIDVYENLYEGLNLSLKYAIKMLEKFENKIDYFYIHIKETDVPGHDNKPHEKVKMLELVDSRLFAYLKEHIQNAKLVVTCDHTTSCRMKAHSPEPVPVLFYPHPKGEVSEKRFTEEQGLKGKKISSRKLLEIGLFSK